MARARSLFRLAWALPKALLDPRTPHRGRLLPLVGLLYLLFPIDLVPDLIPLLGQLDDLGLLAVLLMVAVKAIPGEVWGDIEKRGPKGPTEPTGPRSLH